MADIRIKDLTTLESASLTGDVFVIDGTTGTRKLSAFSPTFGGNATVTGTLTVNGTGTNSIPNLSVTGIGGLNVSANFLTSANTLKFSDSASGGLTWSMSPQLGDGVATNFAFYSNDGVTSTPLFRVSSAGVFRLPSTASSTTTSSGALVVSGGVGVAGAASIGGPILVGTSSDVYLSRVGVGILDIRSASSPGTAARLDVTGTTSAGLGLRQTGTRDWFISAESSELRVSCLTAASIFAFNSGTPVAMRDTTASTSTSSGALVVSGGVGVAGAIYAGGNIQCNAVYASNNTTLYLRPQGATVSSGEAQLTTTGNLTLNGSVQTSAPSGGTAAAWKLGTVATVSPTSPNRTIEVDIGGTIYYIHAKTTNN